VEEVIVRRIGNGLFTCLWRDVWVGDITLCDKFPRLFSLSTNTEASVGELLEVEGERRWWKWSWRRNLFQWEEERVRQLESCLVDVTLSLDGDCWKWSLNLEVGFSVKSAFDSLREIYDDSNLSDLELKVFSWQLLLNRLPTKDNLLFRGVLPQASNGSCVWCDYSPESANHLFLFCKAAHVVWYEIFKWLGVVIVMPPNIMILLECFLESTRNTRLRKGFCFIWHTVVWSIWCARNNNNFNNIKVEPLALVEEIKMLS
jgi:hypothetical protein